MVAARRVGRSVSGPRRSHHQRTRVFRVHETQKAQTKRSKHLRGLPGRAHPKQLSQDQAQIEGRG